MGGGGRIVLRRCAFAGAALAMACLLVACEFLYSIPVLEGPEGGAHDAEPDVRVDARSQDAGRDAGADTGTHEAEAVDTGPTYGSFGDGSSSSWSTFNTESLGPNASGFAGGTFDGRYVYLAPYTNMVAVRYDTHSSYTEQTSWSKFDTTKLFDTADAGIPDPEAGPGFDAGPPTYEFYGSVFDGRYVYLLPGGFGLPSVAVRYDTTEAFPTMSSWESYDLSKLAGGQAYGFGGGAFDGTYVYMVPNYTSIFARYDTKESFSGAGWSTFDLSTLGDGGAGANSFTGAIFDGRYLYLLPGYGETVVMRFDTQGTINSPASWSSFDTSQVNMNDLYGFSGGAFDGRYIYLVPDGNGIVVRYDVTQTFGDVVAWSFFNTSLVKTGSGGFFGGAFDGRYVYLVPEYKGLTLAPSGEVYRYDSTGNFFDTTAWSTFETQPLDNAMGFMGAVFDGQYMYFVPSTSAAIGGIVPRFDARTPPHMPGDPDFHGSFF
jgi:hypothetical protein